jgi:hypothetical protein
LAVTGLAVFRPKPANPRFGKSAFLVELVRKLKFPNNAIIFSLSLDNPQLIPYVQLTGGHEEKDNGNLIAVSIIVFQCPQRKARFPGLFVQPVHLVS